MYVRARTIAYKCVCARAGTCYRATKSTTSKLSDNGFAFFLAPMQISTTTLRHRDTGDALRLISRDLVNNKDFVVHCEHKTQQSSLYLNLIIIEMRKSVISQRV